MKMLNVYAATLALLVVGSGVNAGDMGMGMHNSTLPEFGIQNTNPEHTCVIIESHNGKKSNEACLFQYNVLPSSREQFNDIKHVFIEVSSDKGKKMHKLTYFIAEGATNKIPLRHLMNNTKYTYLLITKDAQGHIVLKAVHRSEVKNYDVVPMDFTCPAK